jgi:hypothetical protein
MTRVGQPLMRNHRIEVQQEAHNDRYGTRARNKAGQCDPNLHSQLSIAFDPACFLRALGCVVLSDDVNRLVALISGHISHLLFTTTCVMGSTRSGLGALGRPF